MEKEIEQLGAAVVLAKFMWNPENKKIKFRLEKNEITFDQQELLSYLMRFQDFIFTENTK